MQLPENVKFFVWRLSHKAPPTKSFMVQCRIPIPYTKSFMVQCHIHIPSICPRCGKW